MKTTESSSRQFDKIDNIHQKQSAILKHKKSDTT